MWYELFVITATLTGLFATTTVILGWLVYPATKLAMPILVEIGEVVDTINQAGAAEGMGRKPEGLMDKLLWFATQTEQGKAILNQFLGNFGGGGLLTP